MRLLSSIKKLNFDVIMNKTYYIAMYSGVLTGTSGGIHAAYKFSPDKWRNSFEEDSVQSGNFIASC